MEPQSRRAWHRVCWGALSPAKPDRAIFVQRIQPKLPSLRIYLISRLVAQSGLRHFAGRVTTSRSVRGHQTVDHFSYRFLPQDPVLTGREITVIMGLDNRIATRHVFESRIQVSVRRGADTVTAQGWTRDLSDSGLGAFVAENLEIGEVISLQIDVGSSERRRSPPGSLASWELNMVSSSRP